jgi:serine/threonine protein kinase
VPTSHGLESPSVPFFSGTRLASYEVIAPLASGGMGEVYSAHDTRLGCDVTMKLSLETLASSLDRLARFEREPNGRPL